ncbi:MAG: phosphoenolpyruvate--protein phosphotransferase [Vicinamibacterales bacterium]
MQRVKGIGVSPGVVHGRAVVLIQRAQVLRYQVADGRLGGEVERLQRSRERSRQQLQDIRVRVEHRRGPELAALFDVQLLMLDDPMLVPRAEALVREQHLNADWALQQVFEEFGAVLDEAADPYLRERRGDVADLVGRLRMNLREGSSTPRDLLKPIEEASVLIADELTPSLAAQVDWTKVRGFATDAGSRTYHTAILARSLGVPAVVGLHQASRLIHPGQLVVIDGTAEEIIIEPEPDMLARIVSRTVERSTTPIGHAHRLSATTADGVAIRLDANIEFPDDVAAARDAGAEGVGLYRSEFILSTRQGVPSEDQQFDVYSRMLKEMAPLPITIRTFDIDEDQLDVQSTDRTLPGSWIAEEGRGSRQGLRGLRLNLTRPDLFRTQIRALLRASSHGNLRLMFPFVSGVEQVRQARRIVTETAKMLVAEGHPIADVPVGVMIEIPAAAYTADLLAREVDFFTIGTNDLIQYCLAVDRGDDRVSRLYEPLHPAILRVIRMVRRAATRHALPVSLCGEMASDPAVLMLLVGLGLRHFSMTPGAMRVARQVLAEHDSHDLQALARRVLTMSTAQEIEDELMSALHRHGVGT